MPATAAVRLPFALWLILSALALGLAAGLDAATLTSCFSQGFARPVGDFVLVLLPSFILARCVAGQITARSGGALAAAPFAAAGMVCPDTAYAALSPLAPGRQLRLAFACFAGFKLLFPAGPLIVATALSTSDSAPLLAGAALLLPVWLAGDLWARIFTPASSGLDAEGEREAAAASAASRTWLIPFLVLAMLVAAGLAFELEPWPVADLLTRPAGALLAAAAVGLTLQPSARRTETVSEAFRQTASLLLLMGAGSAFGSVLTAAVPLERWIGSVSSDGGLIALFLLAAGFKIVQGSSMATFAAVTPAALPLLANSAMNPAAAVLAICLGSFLLILPNDSFYWLVRRSALTPAPEGRALLVLAGGSLVQGLIGFAGLLMLF